MNPSHQSDSVVHFLKYAAAATFAVFWLASCGKPTAKSSESTESIEPPSPESLILYTWAEYFSPEIISEFEEKAGVKIVEKNYENNDEMFETLKSTPDKLDVVVMDDSSMGRAIKLRLLQPIDRRSVPNYKNIDAKYTSEGDRSDIYSVPYTWGTTLIGYRSDKIELSESDKSWKLLFDPRYAGKVSMLDERLECFGTSLRVLGFAPATPDSNEISQATDFLVENCATQQIKFGSDNHMKDHLRSGESWVAMMYSGDAALVAEEGSASEDFDVSFFIPDEGATLFTDGFAISRDSPASKLAHSFINFMAEARIAGETSNHLWYATPNKAALEGNFVNEELASDSTIYPTEEVISRCGFAIEGAADRVRAMNAGWTALKRSQSLVTSSKESDE